jgi:hypothetical protein
MDIGIYYKMGYFKKKCRALNTGIVPQSYTIYKKLSKAKALLNGRKRFIYFLDNIKKKDNISQEITYIKTI